MRGNNISSVERICEGVLLYSENLKKFMHGIMTEHSIWQGQDGDDSEETGCACGENISAFPR